MQAVFRDAPLVVWGATLLHTVIALMLLADPEAAKSTAPAELVQLFGRVPAALVLLTGSVLAVGAMARDDSSWAVALLLPQQILLYIGAWGGLQAVINGQYADGITRPYSFILTDQLPVMVFALLHTLALIELPWRDAPRGK